MTQENLTNRFPVPQPSAVGPALPAVASAAEDVSLWWVICLCAAWCDTCGEYRATFDALAQQWPQARFEWVDIEDESELTGDIDVETFPTVLVADGTYARFLGPLLPQAGVLHRLIASLVEAASSEAASVSLEAQQILERVQAARA